MYRDKRAAFDMISLFDSKSSVQRPRPKCQCSVSDIQLPSERVWFPCPGSSVIHWWAWLIWQLWLDGPDCCSALGTTAHQIVWWRPKQGMALVYFVLFSADDRTAYFSSDFRQYCILSYNIIKTLITFLNPFVNAVSPVSPPTILLNCVPLPTLVWHRGVA